MSFAYSGGKGHGIQKIFVAGVEHFFQLASLYSCAHNAEPNDRIVIRWCQTRGVAKVIRRPIILTEEVIGKCPVSVCAGVLSFQTNRVVVVFDCQIILAKPEICIAAISIITAGIRFSLSTLGKFLESP